MRRLSKIMPAAALAAIAGFTLVAGLTPPTADGANRVTTAVGDRARGGDAAALHAAGAGRPR